MNMSSMSLPLIHTAVSPVVWLSTGAPRDMACSGNVKVYMSARASDETRPVTLSLSYPNGSDRPASHQDFHVLARFQSACMSCCPTGRTVSSLENSYWTPTTYNLELSKWTTVLAFSRLPVCNLKLLSCCDHLVKAALQSLCEPCGTALWNTASQMWPHALQASEPCP